jgi:hypothetical protein
VGLIRASGKRLRKCFDDGSFHTKIDPGDQNPLKEAGAYGERKRAMPLGIGSQSFTRGTVCDGDDR